MEVSWRTWRALCFLLFQRQFVLPAQASPWPMETGIWSARCRTREAQVRCLVCSTAQPFPDRGLIQKGFYFLHVVCPQQMCCPISRDQCLLYQSSISHSQQLLFYCSNAKAGGAPRGTFVRQPGCRAKRGHRKTCFSKAIPRSRQFG